MYLLLLSTTFLFCFIEIEISIQSLFLISSLFSGSVPHKCKLNQICEKICYLLLHTLGEVENFGTLERERETEQKQKQQQQHTHSTTAASCVCVFYKVCFFIYLQMFFFGG